MFLPLVSLPLEWSSHACSTCGNTQKACCSWSCQQWLSAGSLSRLIGEQYCQRSNLCPKNLLHILVQIRRICLSSLQRTTIWHIHSSPFLYTSPSKHRLVSQLRNGSACVIEWLCEILCAFLKNWGALIPVLCCSKIKSSLALLGTILGRWVN